MGIVDAWLSCLVFCWAPHLSIEMGLAESALLARHLQLGVDSVESLSKLDHVPIARKTNLTFAPNRAIELKNTRVGVLPSLHLIPRPCYVPHPKLKPVSLDHYSYTYTCYRMYMCFNF